MPDSYTVLHGKYQRALVTIREITQERDNAIKDKEDMQGKNKIIEKKTQELCESIMKKDRGSRDEKTWFKMSLEEKLVKAQESLDNYFPSIEASIRQLLKNNSERTEKIGILETKIQNLEAKHEKELQDLTALKDEVIKKLTEKLKTGRLDEEEIEKIVDTGNAKKEDIDMPLNGNMSFETEDTDNLEEDMAEAAEAMYEAGELVVPAKHGPPVKQTPKMKEAIKERVKKIEEKQGEKAAKYAKSLSDTQKLILRIMGETGLSELDPIVKTTKKEFPDLKSESTIKTSVHGMLRDSEENGEKLIVATKASIAGSPNFHIYELSETGKDVYTYLFGKEPKESEASIIRKTHTTIEHGYGIQRTAALISEMPYIKNINAEVEYLTRNKENTIKTGKNTAYIPDIVINIEKDGKKTKRYIEYETGKCNETDFFAKCSKIASFTKYINIVVPNNPAKEELVNRIDKWKKIIQEGPFPREDPIRIRISTYLELRESLKNGDSKTKFPWYWEKSISPPKKGG